MSLKRITMTGTDLQQTIIEYAHIKGWRIAHFRPALTKKGWRTPVSGDGEGFPDLIMVRPPRVVVFECKSEKEKVTTKQVAWLGMFRECGLLSRVVRPHNWNDIVKWLE